MRTKVKKSVGTQGVPGGKTYPIGSSYVCIPSDIDRAEFIKHCYRSSTLMIRGENGDTHKNVKIDKTLLQYIDFPQKTGELGTPVVWVQIQKHNNPTIICILDKKGESNRINEEGQFRQFRNSLNGSVEIFGRSLTPELNLSVFSRIAGKGKITLKVVNPDETALVDLFIKGVLNAFGTKQVRLTTHEELLFDVVDSKMNKIAKVSYKTGEGFDIFDEFGNKFITNDKGTFFEDKNGNKCSLNDQGIDLRALNGQKVKVGGDKEPIPLGETLNSNLKELIKAVNDLTTALNNYSIQQGTVTGSGPLAPLAVGYSKLITELSPIVLNLSTLEQKLINNLSKNSLTE